MASNSGFQEVYLDECPTCHHTVKHIATGCCGGPDPVVWHDCSRRFRELQSSLMQFLPEGERV